MPRGVAKNNKNEISKSQTGKLENNYQTTSSTTINPVNDENNIDESSKKQLNLSSEIDNLVEEIDTNKGEESDQTEAPLTKDPKSDLNFFIDDVREAIKESTLSDSSSQLLPGSSNQKNHSLPKFFQAIDNWMYGKIRNPFTPYNHVIGSEKRKRSPIRIIFLIILLFGFGYVLVFAKNKLNQIIPIAVPTFTPVPTYSIPTPFSVQFPGGWSFPLGISNEPFSEWKPNQAEWFKDTTICKLIAIPWTKQIDAVYKTLEPGEELILTMSNNDETIYQIETLETSLVENIIKKLNRNSPCMIIFFYRDSTLTAQVLISTPPIP